MRSTLLIVARRSRWMPMMWQPARARKLPTASPKPLEAPRMRAHPVRAGIDTDAGVVMGRWQPTTTRSQSAAPLPWARVELRVGANERRDATHGHAGRAER